MEISRCEIMSVGKSETEEIVAVISAVLLSGELGEAIAPSEGGNPEVTGRFRIERWLRETPHC